MPRDFVPDEPTGEIWVPDSARAEVERPGDPSTVIIDNRTDLPDEAIEQATQAYFEDSDVEAATPWGGNTQYQTYTGQGSMLARTKFRPPRNIIEEIVLARDLAERDDDIAATLNSMIAAATSDGYQNQHEDEQVQHTFDKMTEDIGLAGIFSEMYREWLISGQVNTCTIFTPATYQIKPEGVARVLQRSVAKPLIGVLPAEQIRVINNDLFGNGELAYLPQGSLRLWLQEYHNDTTTPAKKAELRRQDPLAAALFLGRVNIPYNELFPPQGTGWMADILTTGLELYALNPDMVQRTTMPKGTWQYPRPPLTRNFPLLEAKRLLNIMDHAMLQGGANYIVVARKGSDQKPALPQEISNLREVVRRASFNGVLVGDHRVQLEIVQPDLKELLNPDKRRMLGRKLSLGLLRAPEFAADEQGQAVQTFTEIVSRVITWDRTQLRDHVHRHIWSRVMKRNQSTFNDPNHPLLWFPKLVLQGLQFWEDYLLKMYDRGDIPRKWVLEFGGFDYDMARAQKRRETENGHDDVFTPPAVPFSSPGNNPGGPSPPGAQPGPGPQDNNPGRPKGTGPNNGTPGATKRTPAAPGRPSRTVRQTPGETVKAEWSDEENRVIRIGELTDAILREHPECKLGRIREVERLALDENVTTQRGPLICIPVNPGYEVTDERAVRLDESVSIIIGKRRPDGALVARALTFHESTHDLSRAEDLAVSWGFPVALGEAPEAPEPVEEVHAADAASTGLTLIINSDGKTTHKKILRDDKGNITGVVEEPVEEE